ncbi:MAG TPA: Imm5 family immunity protein [Bryobacteraceae bacterium]|nr:Imm5 family immunity protein [Bryobacteraceae bacterium]
MAISKELEQRITEARDSIERNQEGRLTLGHRQRIWAAMGPRLKRGEMAVPGTGLQRRTSLGILCAQLVVDHWSVVVPGDTIPTQLTVLARRFIEGQVTREEAWKAAHDFWTRLDAMSEKLSAAAYYAGAAAAKTVSVAFRDEDFDPGRFDDSGEDRPGDLPDEWDPALLASASHCSEGESSLSDSTIRRRQFWEWYLTMAVPSAYELVPESS